MKNANKCNNSIPKVTAIIGEVNAYKRYLTLESIFSACCQSEGTLRNLLDKEGDIMFRHTVCPAMKLIRKEKCKDSYKNCQQCYAHIHFKEIRMGCISPDELFYYIIKQIYLSRKERKSRLYLYQSLHITTKNASFVNL